MCIAGPNSHLRIVQYLFCFRLNTRYAHGNWKCAYGSSLFFHSIRIKSFPKTPLKSGVLNIIHRAAHTSQGEFARNTQIYRFTFSLLLYLSDITLLSNRIKVVTRHTHKVFGLHFNKIHHKWSLNRYDCLIAFNTAQRWIKFSVLRIILYKMSLK